MSHSSKNHFIKKIIVHPLSVALLIGTMAFSSLAFIGDTDKYFKLAKNIDLFAKLYQELSNSYVDNIEPAKLMRKGVEGMLKSLDPYTNYITEATIEGFRMKRTSAAADIGVDLMKRKDDDDYIYIKEIHGGLAAQKAGLMAGDKIIAIDGKSAEGRSEEDIKQILQGQPETEVKITIQRYGKQTQETIKVVRDKAKRTSIPYFGMVNENTAYVKLKSFTPSCANEVAGAIQKLQADNKDMKNLILDLRFNGGGLLREAINMANIFIPKDELVTFTKGKTEDWEKEYKTSSEPLIPDMPVAVLINGRSASASEIVSGTLQDLDRGVIIGTRSFGKGLVQQTKKLSYGSQFKLTVAKYYIPSGRCVQAINYSGRYEDGSKDKLPDSLRTAFKTRKGRTVYDGSGVEPDVEIPKKIYGNVTQSLLDRHLIFDFASKYKLANDSIKAAKEFGLTDKDFEDFVAFAQNKDYTYQTKTEKTVEKLNKSAEKEKYKDAIATTITELNNKIEKAKEQDIYTFKDEIMDLLRTEIVTRYYHQKGKVENSLQEDDNVAKAIELFKNKDKYDAILSSAAK